MAKNKDFNYYSGKKYDGMMGRCYRPKNISYKNYGARDIRVTGKWVSDINVFRIWMLNELEKIGLTIEEFIKHSKYIQIDRKDVNGHYTEDNCRLVNTQGNMRNKRVIVVDKVKTAEGDFIDTKSGIDSDIKLENIKELNRLSQ